MNLKSMLILKRSVNLSMTMGEAVKVSMCQQNSPVLIRRQGTEFNVVHVHASAALIKGTGLC